MFLLINWYAFKIYILNYFSFLKCVPFREYFFHLVSSDLKSVSIIFPLFFIILCHNTDIIAIIRIGEIEIYIKHELNY